MLDNLYGYHLEVMAHTPLVFKRYLYKQLSWESQALCIIGDRGVGKSTLICQRLIEHYQKLPRALYISADNINVLANGLLNTAKTFFAQGGEALFIDEVHKYPDWSIELKNIIDIYKNRKIIFTGSSSLELAKSKADLSRRVSYKRLVGLSFREYLQFFLKSELPIFTLDEILLNHTEIVSELKLEAVLKHFQDYLCCGYYPFFLEGLGDYLEKINNMIEKVIYEDLSVIYQLKGASLVALKKIIWLIATAGIFIPNIDNMSKELRLSRDFVYDALEYLGRSGIISNIYPSGVGMKLIRKPGRIYLNNSNTYSAINGEMKLKADVGVVREIFFANQLGSFHKINTGDVGDFLIDDRYVVEIGGAGKTKKQIKQHSEAYLALDGIEIGAGNRIPLYLFGFLY
ncbi:MAG: AAA family ATPase [Gammaproteobacteria bacterium]